MFGKPCKVFALVVLVLLFGCSREQGSRITSTLGNINSTHKLRVGYIVFPPTVTKDPNTGKLGGHDVAAIREIARLSSWEIEFVETDWSTFPAGLAGGRFDVSIAPTFVT